MRYTFLQGSYYIYLKFKETCCAKVQYKPRCWLSTYR